MTRLSAELTGLTREVLVRKMLSDQPNLQSGSRQRTFPSGSRVNFRENRCEITELYI